MKMTMQKLCKLAEDTRFSELALVLFNRYGETANFFKFESYYIAVR